VEVLRQLAQALGFALEALGPPLQEPVCGLGVGLQGLAGLPARGEPCHDLRRKLVGSGSRLADPEVPELGPGVSKLGQPHPGTPQGGIPGTEDHLAIH